MGADLAALSAVFKVRISVAIVFCALAGMAIMPGPALSPWQIVVLALVVFLSSSAAGAFNHFAERDLDARMPRTRNRPFVTGRFTAGYPWIGLIGLILAVAVAGAALGLNAHVAVYIFLGAVVYGLVYTIWLKRRTAWNIVIGGLSGSFAVMAGAAAVDPELSTAALLLAITLFLWTPPHFWSLATVMQDQYARADVPMLPVVMGPRRAAWVILGHTLALVAVSLMPVFFGLGPVYFLGALAGGVFFIWRSIELVREPSPRRAWANFKASFVQLALLLGAAMIDGVAGWP